MKNWMYFFCYFIFSCCVFVYKTQAQNELLTDFERDSNRSASYEDCIDYFQKLDQRFKELNLISIGASDVGDSLKLVIIDKNGFTDPTLIRKAGRALLLINNGIHPGEPEGIDACMMLARDVLLKRTLHNILDSVSILIIPIYNVGGSKMRNNYTRINQNGPEEYGFRGNRNYLDLNRDFIKSDAANTKTFQEMFMSWQPDVYIETHTTNGADYPYNLTLLSAQKNKLNTLIADLFYIEMIPYLNKAMEKDSDPICPYVNAEGSPRHGIYGFMDSPRYSSGYTSLYHCFSLLVETHMLKHYKPRVESTYRFLVHCMQYLFEQNSKLRYTRKKAFELDQQTDLFCLKYKLSKTHADSIYFSGYDTQMVYYPELQINLHHYNPQKKYKTLIPFYDHFDCSYEVQKPKYYILPRAYHEVTERLRRNGIVLDSFTRDTMVEAWFYKIGELTSASGPNEGHFPHQQVELIAQKLKYPYFKGDYIISTQQKNIRYLMTVLEPGATDSYFMWNFFDGILQRKEYFSDYLFAPVAEKLLNMDQNLKARYLEKLASDPEFKASHNKKLAWIYEQSGLVEPYYRIYPVAKIE